MSNQDIALETRLNNIEKKTGKSLSELSKLVNASSPTKHGEMRDMLREKFSLGYGDVKWSSTWLKNPALRVGSKASLASVENALNVSDAVLNLNYHFL